MDENVQVTPAKDTHLTSINVEEEMKNSYIDYSMSVIVSRALPDARDGFKPVHRRVLYAMYAMKNFHDAKRMKSARQYRRRDRSPACSRQQPRPAAKPSCNLQWVSLHSPACSRQPFHPKKQLLRQPIPQAPQNPKNPPTQQIPPPHPNPSPAAPWPATFPPANPSHPPARKAGCYWACAPSPCWSPLC